MTELTRRMMLAASTAAILTGGMARAQTPASAPPPVPSTPSAPPPPDTEWRHYANDLAATRYAPLSQIDATNFNKLEVAWRFRTESFGDHPEFAYEGTPLLIKGRLYCTAGSRRDVVALDAATGEILWMYRMDEGQRALNSPRQLSGHGVSYWTDGARERILFVTIGYRLVSLDARTGLPDTAFGENGVVDLKRNNDYDIDPVTGDIGLHATPMVAGDVVIVGAAHSSGNAPKTRFNARGSVRGFDARTGKRLWIFHTIPRKGEYGYDSWATPGQADVVGNGGAWSEMSVDEELGLVYVGVELATGDEMGMYRAGNALFGESVVALDYRTGQRKWHYQTVHHGLWDSDIPCAAILCDIPHNGRIVKALAQPTKQCFLYVLDRATGNPIWPIVEKPVPRGDVPGEWYAPTQPIPTKPPAYDRQGMGDADLIDFTPEIKARAREIASHYKMGPLYTPPMMSRPEGPWGTLTLPGAQGGSNWAGGAYDPETHMVYVYSKTQMQSSGIIANTDRTFSDFDYIRGTAGVAQARRAAMGSAASPMNNDGPGRTDTALGGPVTPGFITIAGLPLVKPPYGRISALDLTHGTLAWQVAHGETPDAIRNNPLLKGVKIPRTGQAALIGPLCTKTLVVCGDGGRFTDTLGRNAARLRAYDKATGEEKGTVFLPAPQGGAPMTYMHGGRQYIVLTIGGPGYPAEMIAFRLPDANPAPAAARPPSE